MRIVIPGECIAKKNSQRIIKKGKIRSIRPSAAYDKWAEAAAWELTYQLQQKRIERYAGSYPVIMSVFIYRRTRRKFDLSNMLEGTQDILQAVKIIEDDSMNHLIPVFEMRDGCYGWAVDKENPRVEVELVAAARQGADNPISPYLRFR